MKDIYPQTNNEKRMNVGIQNSLGAYPNGVLGCQTLIETAIKLGVDCFPITLQIYGQPVIVGNDLIAFDPNASLKNFSNSMLGSFTYPRAEKPCSILVNNGQVICDQSCRAWAGYPEAVIYRFKDGTFGHGEYKYAKDLPSGVIWAVGGFGLLDMWNPKGQGFKIVNGTDYYNSVVYKTNHNVLGVKHNKVWGVCCKNMTGEQVNNFCRDKMKFDFAVMLDGGGLAAMNGDESFAKINTNIKQGYAVQFI